MTGMLDGITVLDFATVGPAARASRWLADYGADVVKVGAPPRQAGVQIEPPFYAYSGHRGMRRVQLDLKAAAGRDAFLALAATADVVIESFRPGVADRLGVGYDAVRSVNETIVYCSTSGYGQTGPKSQWAGHDLNYLALGGYLDCSGRTEAGAPALPGATIGDSAGGGMQAVMAVLAALVQRERTGQGAHLDVAVADGVLAFMSLYIDEYLATGEVPGPGHNILTGKYACYDLYEAADGRWLAVGAIEPHFFANLCRFLGCEQFVEHQMDDDRQDEIRAAFRTAFATRDRDDWVAELAPADCCVSPVLTVPELIDDAQVSARGAVVDAEHPSTGRFRQLGAVLAGQADGDPPVAAPDWSVTQTDDLLIAAGYERATIDELRTEGVIA